jgi:type IV pilus assembly protein PilB
LGTLPPIGPHPTAVKKRRLGEILMDAGVVDELQLKAALAEQRKWGGKLGRTLVEMGFVDEESMVLALSRQLNLPLVHLDRMNLPPEIVQLLRVDIAERYGVFPLSGDRKQKVLQIATSDPTNVEALQELSFNTGLHIQVSVSTASGIDRAIRRLYYGESTVASLAATPQSMGLTENTYDPDLMQGPSAPAVAAPLRNGASASANAELTAKVAELSEQVAALEKLTSNQVRALRGMLELMVEKGVLTREEYLAKVRSRTD